MPGCCATPTMTSDAIKTPAKRRIISSSVGAGVLASRIRVLAHQCVLVAALKILMHADDFVSLARDIRLEYIGCDGRMILDRYYLTDVVT